MKQSFFKRLTSGVAHSKLRRGAPVAIILILMGTFSNVGTRLGFWSAPGKSGLIPYEAPNFQPLGDLIVSNAFAST